MSWLARSIVNSLKLNDADDDHDHNEISKQQQDPPQSSSTSSSSPLLSPTSSESQQGRGVKEDLSELTKTLTRQFWGVASFLAPPVDSPGLNHADSRSDADDAEDVVGVSGLRSDFAEIGGRFKTGISKLSGNIGVSEISKIASSFLQFGSDYEAVGVTEEVIAFAKSIALHPETWLDFPLPDEDDDDFDMSDTQQEHALAVEHLAPELTAIRIEICPEYMSEDHFWKIYFVLLHSILKKDDAELLSTPQVVKARAMLMHELPSRLNANSDPELSVGGGVLSNESATSSHEVHLSVPTSSSTQPESLQLNTSEDQSTSTVEVAHPYQNTEIKIIDKPIAEEEPSNQAKYHESVSLEETYEDDGDDWLKEESLELGGTIETTISISNDEDVTFSDLEDDDDVSTSHNKK